MFSYTSKSGLKFRLLILLVLLIVSYSYGQNKSFASILVNSTETDNSANAIDGSLDSYATIRASSGIAVGIGSYSGSLELQFSSILAPGTTSYVKIDAEESILSSLVGGSLGELLSDINGTLLIGNQEFTVQALSGANVVLEGESGQPDSFGDDNLQIVIDTTGDFYIAITPNTEYNRIRITNRLGSLIGLNEIRELHVFGAFYITGQPDCGQPSYTSFDGTGLTLDLLDLGGAGATDLENAIDSDSNTSSELGLGVIGTLASIRQTILFEGLSESDQYYYIRLALDPSLLAAGLANNIILTAHSGTNSSINSVVLSSLLTVDLLTLLQSGNPVTIAVPANGQSDMFSIELSSLLNINLNQRIEIFEVYRAPAPAVVDIAASDTSICSGVTASLVANSTAGTQLRWYDAPIGGMLIATVDTGESFTTVALNTDTTYYVSAGTNGCVEESSREAVTVRVTDIPTASDIEISGNLGPFCSNSTITLYPSSLIEGTFRWYIDANATVEVTDGMLAGGITYSISSEGNLTIQGLDEANSPYTFYTSLTEATNACENLPGNLKSVTIDVVDSNTNVSINLDSTFTIENLIEIFQGNSSYTISGSVSGDANVGDSISLLINGQIYSGTLDNDSSFDVTVDGTLLALDPDGVIEVLVDNGTCTITDSISIELPDLPIDELLQVFCASDNPTLLDLEVTIENVVFFDSLEATTALDFDTPLVDGGVYFAGVLGVPTSVLLRVQINVELIIVPPPTTESNQQTFCANANATVADLQVNESDVVFYDSPIDGQELDPNTPLEDGQSYYGARRDAIGCESTVRLEITVSLEEQAIIVNGQTDDVCINREYTFTTEPGMQDYMWTVTEGMVTDGGTISDDFITVRFTSLQGASISVLFQDNTGCTSSAEARLEPNVISCGEVLSEEFCLFVYNEFTPNNDGFNDFFEIQCIEQYSNTVRIFNRYGNKVFETVDYQNDWNGIANTNGILNGGEHLPSGTYYYVINIPELNRDLVGWLQLAR